LFLLSPHIIYAYLISDRAFILNLQAGQATNCSD
jgi:hypothetical protein